MAMEIIQILLNAQVVDGTVRNHAEESLEQFRKQNFPSYLFSLAGEVVNEEKPVESRKLAGVLLKNALDAKEQHRKFEYVKRWLSLDVGVKIRGMISVLLYLACNHDHVSLRLDHIESPLELNKAVI
ncbi:hypothetical protein Drorol1_Dr00000617 [Drosera rotundifolia]